MTEPRQPDTSEPQTPPRTPPQAGAAPPTSDATASPAAATRGRVRLAVDRPCRVLESVLGHGRSSL